MDGLCPWGYEEAEQEHMRMCVMNPGLGEAANPPTISLPDYSGSAGPGSFATQQARVAQAGFQNLYTGGAPSTDYTWLIYAALGIGALVLFSSKGRR